MNFSNLPPEIISYHIATFLTNSDIAALRLTARYLRNALVLISKLGIHLNVTKYIESAYRRLAWVMPAVRSVYLTPYRMENFDPSNWPEVYQIVSRLSPQYVDLSRIDDFNERGIGSALQSMSPSVRVLTVPAELRALGTNYLLHIMDAYPKIYLQDSYGFDLLYMFCKINNLDAVTRLITQHKPNLNKLYTKRTEALLETAIRYRRISLANLLIDAGADVNIRPIYANPPVMTAIFNVDVVLVQKLLAHGADLNLSGIGGFNAIDYAKLSDSEEIKSILRGALKQ